MLDVLLNPPDNHPVEPDDDGGDEYYGEDCYDCGTGYIFHKEACLYKGQAL